MIRTIQVKTSVEPGGKGSAEVRVTAGSIETDGLAGTFLWAQLLDGGGAEADRIFPVPLQNEISFCMEAPGAHLWNAERPYFYELVLELRDGEGKLLGSTAKKISFLVRDDKNGETYVNGKKVRLRPYGYHADRANEPPEKMLAAVKKARYNALLRLGKKEGPGDPAQPANMQEEENLRELCREYGLYYLKEDEFPQEEDEWAAEVVKEQPADFSMEVTRQGVLIENHCVFANASEYDLDCRIEKEGRVFAEEVLSADIPPQRTRFVEFSMACPQEAGEYVCRAALCLKRDTPWAPKGYAVAEGSCVWCCLFQHT